MARDLQSVRRFCKSRVADEVSLLTSAPADSGTAAPLLRRCNVSRGSPKSSHPETTHWASCCPTRRCTICSSATRPEQPSEFPALVMTSGNLSEEPIVVIERRGALNISPRWPTGSCCTTATLPPESTILWCAPSKARERVLRRSRGFVPHTIDLGIELQRGARRRRRIEKHLLPHQRPLRHPQPAHRRPGKLRDHGFFEETLAKMKHLFRVTPQAIAHDLHPGY